MATASLLASIAETSRHQEETASYDARQADRYFVSLLKSELERREQASATQH